MLNTLPLLAQQAQNAPSQDPTGGPITALVQAMQGRLDLLTQPDQLIPALSQLHLLWASVFIFLGAVAVLNGYRWHKTVILVLASLAGVVVGLMLGPRIGVTGVVAATALAILFSVLSLPMMRYTVAVFAGLIGAFVGANCWTAFGGPDAQHHFGAVIGLIALGLLAFVTFRVVIIAFTAIGGSALLTMGVLAALLKLPGWQQGLAGALERNPLIVPLIAAVTAADGFVLQHTGGFKGLNEAADRADPAKTKAKAEAKPA